MGALGHSQQLTDAFGNPDGAARFEQGFKVRAWTVLVLQVLVSFTVTVTPGGGRTRCCPSLDDGRECHGGAPGGNKPERDSAWRRSSLTRPGRRL
eukprot:3488848-Rhodomonas_salina.2